MSHYKKIEKLKEAHRAAGPFKNAAEAIKSPTFNAVHRAIAKSKALKRKTK